MKYLDEHYTHARVHEALRAQITAILSGAGFAVIGWGLAKDTGAIQASALGVAVMVIGTLSYYLTYLHFNRIDAHLAAARALRNDLETRLSQNAPPGAITIGAARLQFSSTKRGSLARTWHWVSAMIVVAGGLLFLFGLSHLIGLDKWAFWVTPHQWPQDAPRKAVQQILYG
jgi:hypothetical protein